MKAHRLHLVSGRSEGQGQDWTCDLEDYLDCMNSVLVGQIPYRDRQRLREETRDHMACLVRDLVDRGMDPKEAFGKAVEAFGASDWAAKEYLSSWYRRQAQGPLASRLGLDTLVALGWLAAAQAVCSGLALVNVLAPGASALSYVVDPAVFYSVFPESMPAPEASLLHLLMALSWAGCPLLAGWMTGRSVPSGAALAMLKGLGPCVAYSLVSGLLLLPSRDLLALGAVQVLWWAPAGAFAAHVSSAFAWKRRCRYPLRRRR